MRKVNFLPTTMTCEEKQEGGERGPTSGKDLERRERTFRQQRPGLSAPPAGAKSGFNFKSVVVLFIINKLGLLLDFGTLIITIP